MGEAPRRIVVRVPNWVGDAVMATAAFRCLRRGFPEARIALALRPRHVELFAGLDSFDETIPLPGGGARAIMGWARAIRAGRFDLAMVLPNSFSSALTLALAGVPRRVGYAGNLRGLLLTDRLRAPREGRRRRPAWMVDYYLDLCALVGLAREPRRPELRVTAEEDERCERFLRGRGWSGEPLVAVNPGASFGPSKLWRGDAFAAAADRIAGPRGATVLVLVGPGEEDVGREVERHLRGRRIGTADAPLSFGPLKAALRRSLVLLTTDAGPRHVAVALDRPVVTVMGPTDPRYSEGAMERQVVLRRTDVECSPCHLKVCPIDHRCMERLTADDAVAAAERLLGVRT